MHLVHYNHAKHETLSKALEARDGSVSVLGVFFEVRYTFYSIFFLFYFSVSVSSL